MVRTHLRPPPRHCLQVSTQRADRKPLTAPFGGIPLKRHRPAVLTDRQPPPVATRRKELITLLLAGRCDMCAHTGEVEVHQAGRLARLGKPGQQRPAWADVMACKQRKTLVVCATCHDTIHACPPSSTLTT